MQLLAHVPLFERPSRPFIALAVAALVGGTPAAAEGWQEYSYPDYSVAVAFPAEPKIEITTYPAADGVKVEARVYSVTQGNAVFKLTIADLSEAVIEENAAIDRAIKLMSQGGEIKVDIPHRVRRVYGRQLSVARADGGRSLAAVFYYKQRLYQIEGTSLPGGNATAEAIRFQQSLMFTDDASNRAEPASAVDVYSGAANPGAARGENRRGRGAENGGGRGRRGEAAAPTQEE
jgi:hypothetical protein